MFIKTSILLPIFVANSLIIVPISEEYNKSYVNPSKVQSKYNVEGYKMLSSIPEENIYLYAMDWKEEDIKHKGVYRDILLDLKGKQRYFPWYVDINPSFKPRLILTDINNDRKDELIVITTTSEGTGVFIQQVHVFSVDTYNDINVMDPLEAIYQNVKTEITKQNSIVTITITIKDKPFIIKAKESSAGIWYDDIAFGSLIEYDVVDNKVIAKVGAQAAFGVICGSISIDYVFKNKRLELNEITFEKIKDQNLFN